MYIDLNMNTQNCSLSTLTNLDCCWQIARCIYSIIWRVHPVHIFPLYPINVKVYILETKMMYGLGYARIKLQ